MLFRPYLVALAALLLSSCSEDPGAGPEGKAGDALLYKLDMSGQVDRLGLIYGFANDMEFCVEIAQMYNQRYPQANLSCSIVQ